MDFRRWAGCGLLLCSLMAFCTAPLAARRQPDLSMHVTGTIRVDATGAVTGYDLDREEALPSAVVDLLRKAVLRWRFEPVQRDGKPAGVETSMGLRIVATPRDEGLYGMRVRGASFGTPGTSRPDEDAKGQDQTPPDYPRKAVLMGAQATVYLVVKVGRDGSVEDVVAEQVNVRLTGSDKTVERFRTLFAEASVAKARSWRFQPPLRGPHADAPNWSVRTSVQFAFEESDYGQWEIYQPGPIQPVPWDIAGEGTAFTPDSLPHGSYSVGGGLRLLDSLGPGR